MTPTCTPATGTATHLVTNQPPPLQGYDAVADDPLLERLLAAPELAAVHPLARSLGSYVGSAEALQHASDANRHPPTLRTHDRYGHRIDQVDYHPAYHTLMSVAARHGVHGHAWRDAGAAPFTSRAALVYLWNQLENGTACPLTMTFAGVQVMRNAPALAAVWEPRLTACDYDPRPLPVDAKRAALVGMAMTEKQGGSDVRANTTRAVPLNGGGPGGEYEITGHKWFCSAPMCDAFLVLAQTDAGVSCFLLPRFTPNGERNRFHIQRLKEKLGNKSNASSEIEFRGAWARMIGEDGRGIRTIIEMVSHTRLDCAIGSSAGMRTGVAQATHHAMNRSAFGKKLIDQPLMENVLADLCVESEAATATVMRLARAYDEAAAGDEGAALLQRLATPVLKYWICKRAPWHAVESLECFGGNGYAEESGMPRLFRESPLMSIWEGSGNVQCLDALRAMVKSPASYEAFFSEVGEAAGADSRLDSFVEKLQQEITGEPETLEIRARRVVEGMGLAFQGSMLVRHGDPAVADAFCASRLAGDWGEAFGTLPAGTDFKTIIQRSAPPV